MEEAFARLYAAFKEKLRLEAAVPEPETKLLEHVKALSPIERGRFIELFHDWESEAEATLEARPQIDWSSAEARLKRRFPDGGLTGNPQGFWDELRAERS